MPASFSRTQHALKRDRQGIRLFLTLGILLMVGWGCWLVWGEVAVYHATERARIEVSTAAHPFASVVDGRIIATSIEIGREVAAGETLVVLDSETETQACEEARVRRDNFRNSHAALLKVIVAEESASKLAVNARVAAHEEFTSKVAEAQIHATLAQEEDKISAKLESARAVTVVQRLRDRAEVDSCQAVLHNLRTSDLKTEQEFVLAQQERQVKISALRREVADLEGSAASQEQAILRLTHLISQRTIRAPISGVLGEVAPIRIGSVVTTADKLGTIIPHDLPRGVAFFPVASVGRLKPGQRANLRLEAYPWTQFGTVPATVAGVGNEATNGFVRVVLDLQPNPDSAIPLTHGLPGTLEVEVEKVNPLTILLRAAGQYLAPRASQVPITEAPTTEKAVQTTRRNIDPT